MAGVRPGSLPSPGGMTFALAVAGLALGWLALRVDLVLRLVPLFVLVSIAGLGLTRIGFGPALALALVPLGVWAGRLGWKSGTEGIPILLLGVLVGVGISVPGLYLTRAIVTLPIVAVIAALALAGTFSAFVDPGPPRTAAARFDLRAALAVAGLVVVGFVVAFLLGQAGIYMTSAREAGGLARPLPSLGPLALLVGFALLTVILRRGGGVRAASGLVIAALALVLASVPALVSLAIIMATVGLALVLEPSLRRAARVHEALPVATLALAPLLGMPLAAGLVRGFTRPLLGAVPGIATATATSWGVVLGFYAALALVVLLAHLAHAYEFGFAALDPDDDRDPLPILRKGLAGLKAKT